MVLRSCVRGDDDERERGESVSQTGKWVSSLLCMTCPSQQPAKQSAQPA